MAATFSKPEDNLVLALCGHVTPMGGVEQYASDPSVDWEYVVETAREHKVAPLVLSRALSLDLPQPIRAALGREARGSVSSTIHDALVFREELRKVREALTANGIGCILLKGLSLDPSLSRPVGDIDLLVPRERLPDAIQSILGVPGYFYREKFIKNRKDIWRCCSSLTQTARALIIQQAELLHEFQMSNSERGVLVELHVRLFSREGRREDHAWGAISGDEVIRRIWAERCYDSELGCNVPSAAHSLLSMCLHVALKRSPAVDRFRLGILVDIDRLVSAGIQWGRFTIECADLHLSPYAYFSLLLARRLLGVPVPNSAISELRQACTGFQLLLTRVHLRCVDSLVSSNALYSNMYRWLQPWAFGGTWRERLSWSVLTPLWLPSRGYMAVLFDKEIDSPLLLLAYALLPVRWALHLLSRLLDRLEALWPKRRQTLNWAKRMPTRSECKPDPGSGGLPQRSRTLTGGTALVSKTCGSNRK